MFLTYIISSHHWPLCLQLILGAGAKVREFETMFSDNDDHNIKSSLAVTSCTTGLQLILGALDIGQGDEVIVPAFTWVSTANVVVHANWVQRQYLWILI